MELKKFAKQKAKQPSYKKGVAGAAATSGGLAVADVAAPAALGKKRLYHGTSKDAWKTIKKEGLRGKHGGKIWGAGGSVNDPELAKIWQKASEGKVHTIPSKAKAKGYARLAGKASKGAKVSPFSARVHLLTGALSKGREGKVVKVHVPYEDVSPALKAKAYEKAKGKIREGLRSGKFPTEQDLIEHIEGLSKKIKGRFKPDPYTLGEGLISKDIPKSEIGRKAMFKSLKDLPQYIRKHPKRFAKGLLGVGGGLGLAAYGSKKLYDLLKGKEKR